ncbi:MAG: hypothetical protein IKR69_04045 [Bacteroidales bacterium]|nr:hypothetical protein [Bacteroidales bacterium]
MSRKETIWAIVLLTIIGTSMHFVHHLPFFNHFLGYIFPVQESVMAHTKMVFYPSLLLSLYLVVSRRDIREIGAPVLGGLAMVPAIIACFFAYWVFVRHEIMALDVLIYIASMVGFVLLAKRLRRLQLVRRGWPIWTVLILIDIFLTGFLTYNYPTGWIIFADLS